MSNRALMMALVAALFAATGYGAMNAIDSQLIAQIRHSIKTLSNDPMAAFKGSDRQVIAQKFGGTNPHGDDPHGDDPADEIHDPDLPANEQRSFGKAPKDVYGGAVNNSQKPY